MDVQDCTILIHSPRQPRAGWGAAFTQMARLGDDKLLDPRPIPTSWDKEDWPWK